MKKNQKEAKVVVTEENELLEPVKIGNKKTTVKPWRVSTQIVDEKVLNMNSFFENNKKLNVWSIDPWYKFMSIEHGLRELNKEGRSNNWKMEPLNTHWRFAGKEYKLVNIDTGEEILLNITEREVILHDNKNSTTGS